MFKNIFASVASRIADIFDSTGYAGQRIEQAFDESEQREDRREDREDRRSVPPIEIDFGVVDWPDDVLLRSENGKVHMEIEYEIITEYGEIMRGKIERYNWNDEDIIRGMVLSSLDVDSEEIVYFEIDVY